jgi:hypothetical protein
MPAVGVLSDVSTKATALGEHLAKILSSSMSKNVRNTPAKQVDAGKMQ